MLRTRQAVVFSKAIMKNTSRSRQSPGPLKYCFLRRLNSMLDEKDNPWIGKRSKRGSFVSLRVMNPGRAVRLKQYAIITE